MPPDVHPPLRVVALAKQIPVNDVALAPGSGLLMRATSDTEMNAFCRRAVAMAVQLSEGGDGATVVTMGPPSAADLLRESAAWGARHAWHLCDPGLAGADALMTAGALAAALDLGGPFDLVLVGRNSLDAGTGTIGPMIAENLGLPYIDSVTAIAPDDGRTLRVEALTERGSQTARIRLPAVLSVAERLCRPAKLPPAQWLPSGDVKIRHWRKRDLEQSPLFVAGSPTTVHRVIERTPHAPRRPLVLDQGPAGSRVRIAMDTLRERGVLPLSSLGRSDSPPSPRRGSADQTGDNRMRPLVAIEACGTRELGLVSTLVELSQLADAPTTVVVPESRLTGRGIERLAKSGANTIVVAHHCDERPFADALARYVALRHNVVVANASTWGREVMGRLAARLSMGLITEVQQLRPHGSRVAGIKAAPGGQLADVRSSSRIQLFTVGSWAGGARTRPCADPRLESLEVGQDDGILDRRRRATDEWDTLERASVVIGVGQGVRREDMQRIDALRVAVAGQFAATRKVTDQGWLPHSRQVGITGRDLSPRLYIAIGVSGSPNHLSGVAGAHTIVAINPDPEAPIFRHCDIGIVARWQEVVEPLSEQFKSAALLDDGFGVDISASISVAAEPTQSKES